MYVNHSRKLNNGDGCQASNKDGKCGEMRSLGILKEFQQLYEDKLSKVEKSCTCLSSQVKVQMLQDWVKDLTEQNTLLVQVVEELEHEASERVALLEDRLRHSSSTSYEIMQTLQEYDSQNLTEQSDILRQLMYYQSDINNLTEFIRRIREDGLWSVEGLHFYCVSHDDLCNDVPVTARDQKDIEDAYIKLKLELDKAKKMQKDLEHESKAKELMLQDQSEQIEKLNNVVERCATSMPDRQRLLEELHELRTQVKYKTEEYVKLEQSVKDMREALTAEVADKHDSILTLRRECQLLEEQCRQADKQTHFKDDIIKEMRRELKQLRTKCDEEIQKLPEDFQIPFDSLEQENVSLRKTITDAHQEIIVLHQLIQKYNREQHETINILKSKLNHNSVALQSKNDSNDTLSDSEPDFTQSIFVLKQNINKMFSLKDNEEIMQLRKQLIEVDNAMQEIENRDKLIQNKDQLITIQSDTLNVAQRELKELRDKVLDIEDERDTRLQEVRNLQQALKLHQNTIEELEKALRNSEEKAGNIQQTRNIEKVLYTNELLENDITYLKGEMSDLAKELLVLQELLKITNLSTDDKKLNVTKSLQILQEHSESLVEQLKDTQAQVTREIQLNGTSSAKIEELKQLLEIKTVELQNYEIHLSESKTKLDESIQKSLDYESKLKSMEVQLLAYESQQNQMHLNKEHIILKYNSDLMCLKQKVEILSQILSDKSDNLLQLHTELSVKEDSVTNLTNENERLKLITKDEVHKLNQNIKKSEQQLTALKPKYTEICEKYKQCRTELEVLKQKERVTKAEFVEEKNKLKSQLDKSEIEENRLNHVITELKTDLDHYKVSLNNKTGELKELSCAQEEILALKDEINKLTRLRNRILCDNQKLQDQIVKLNIHTSQFEERNQIISQQLDKCLQELGILQCAKDKLEERNVVIENEVEHFRRSYAEMSQEIRYKNESVLSLEQELSETKCNRDEISAESRIVLNNINLWLEEQRQINKNLSITVKEKNVVIEELNLERNLLLKNIKDVCERYTQLSQEFRRCQQYEETKKYPRSSEMRRSIYTWGSQGSLSDESPIGSPIFGDYEEEVEPNPATWLRRVQSMSDELQKCNKYWKTEFGNAKKFKAVKDNSN